MLPQRQMSPPYENVDKELPAGEGETVEGELRGSEEEEGG